MPSSADAASPPEAAGASASPRDAVVRTVIALERSCLDAESAFVNRRWHDVDAAFAAQRALTGELRRLFALAPETTPANDAKVARRVRGVLAYRDDQLRRMRAYHDDVGERLRSIGKVRALARTIGRRRASGRLVDGQY